MRQHGRINLRYMGINEVVEDQSFSLRNLIIKTSRVGLVEKRQIGGKRKNELGNQGQSDEFGGSKQAQKNFVQWPLYNKCKRQHLGDYNDSLNCYNCEKLVIWQGIVRIIITVVSLAI